MRSDNLIEVVKKMAFNGMDYEAIMNEIEKNKKHLSVESIDAAKNKIDDYIIGYELASQEKSKALNQIIIGSILLFIGVVITGYTYFTNNSQYVLAYGAILGGAWILKEGYKIYRKPIDELTPRRGVFRR